VLNINFPSVILYLYTYCKIAKMFGKKSFLAIAVLVLAYGYNTYKTHNRERTPVIKTDLGSIQGIVSESRQGRRFYEFLGVPYAAAPVKELRFEVRPVKMAQDNSNLSVFDRNNKNNQTSTLNSHPNLQQNGME